MSKFRAMLVSLTEGKITKADVKAANDMSNKELKVFLKKLCICDGGSSANPDNHADNCPCFDLINKMD